ncbi:MAG: hypothetical protein ACE5I1_13860, partial [bacterium]
MLFKTHFSYKVRNILTLSALLFLVLAIGGYFCFIYYARKEAKIDHQLAEIQKPIDELEFVVAQLTEAEKKLQLEQIKLASIDKQIAAEVTPEDTYQYLNTILSYSGPINFNMSFTGRESRKKYQQKVYHVKGEGNYQAIFRFISYLEEGPEIYKIRKMSLRGEEKIDLEARKYEVPVSFEMEILALYAEAKDLPKIDRKISDVSIAKTRNAFYPYIKKELPTNFDDLLDVRQAELKAILLGKAFVVDSKGSTHTLTPGEKVYLGFLRRIDEAQNRLIFQLDKGGIAEEFILKML